MSDEDLESIRRKNIRRNRELLKQLKLDTLNESISQDVSTEKKRSRSQLRGGSRISKPKEKPLPTRRSKRIANAPEDVEEQKRKDEEEDRAKSRQITILNLRLSKLSGNFSLTDLLCDKKLSRLLFENKVLKVDEHVPEMKADEEIHYAHEESKDDILQQLHVLNTIRKCGEKQQISSEVNETGKNSQTTLHGLSSLSLDELIDWSKVKLTANRITSLTMHSTESSKLVIAGDTNGCIGLWNASEERSGDDLSIVELKPHGRTVSRLVEVPSQCHQFVSASYDGSCRLADLVKQISSEILGIVDSDGDNLGVSDIHMPNPNVLYLTTLNGQFLQHDIRQPFNGSSYSAFQRLHDKKIGGFSSNPNAEFQIATASLDRTLRLWDMRKSTRSNLLSEIDDGLPSFHMYGSFSSRLSISNVDWNENDHIVCNGYEDKIDILNLEGNKQRKSATNWKETYTTNLNSALSIYHNCQTGRWVSILKARWQAKPQDGVQKFAIANMNRSIDVYGESGELLARLSAPDVMTAVPAVVSWHPTQNRVVGGTSSGKVFVYE